MTGNRTKGIYIIILPFNFAEYRLLRRWILCCDSDAMPQPSTDRHDGASSGRYNGVRRSTTPGFEDVNGG